MRIIFLLIGLLGLTACGVRQTPAPVSNARFAHYAKAKVYTVRRGDTLYAVAWQFDKNYKTLARINRLKAPYHLNVGQRIRLTAPVVVTKQKQSVKHRAAVKKPKKRQYVKSTPKGIIKKAKSAQKQQARVASSSTTNTWYWPTSGRILKRFNLPNQKGIDIIGRRGQKIVASRDGIVAYSGNGLEGYGNLLILRHKHDLLSAYAHNRKLLVKEGQIIKAGQVIAEMGSIGTNRPMLHFEVRHFGKPVNPLKYLAQGKRSV